MLKVRLGIIGCGSITKHRHAPEAKSNENVDLVAVCDNNLINAEKVAKMFDVPKVYADYETMLKEEKPDAVVVAAPNYIHADATIKALKAGAHVLCEKPMATTIDECKKMVDTAKETGKFLMIAHNQRFNKAHIKAKQIIQSGELGRVLSFKTTFGHGGPESWSSDKPDTWFFHKEKATFGSMGDLGVHKIDLMRFLLGEEFVEAAALVTTLAKRYPNGELIDVDDNAVCILKTQSGAIGTVTASWTYPGSEDNSTIIYCEKGSITLYGDPKFSMIIRYANGQKAYFELDTMQTNEKQTKSGVMDEFINSILTNTPPKISGEEGLKTMKVVFACFESAKTGKVVKIDY
ncbi:Gfo/Idh/MocA family protein [Caldicellulosiruptor sp. DIB 104C]|uniref:Gfo/Idh/MocA family protein n=1 Tax=Caldicellulosiruptor sp. DIB 104C TaxID=3019889 RepID=UPI002305556C|nr:Gfo/Idh/MocA family oxidoreductase [Caldicellulosiruptor sp. DIB 104C]